MPRPPEYKTIGEKLAARRERDRKYYWKDPEESRRKERERGARRRARAREMKSHGNVPPKVENKPVSVFPVAIQVSSSADVSGLMIFESVRIRLEPEKRNPDFGDPRTSAWVSGVVCRYMEAVSA